MSVFPDVDLTELPKTVEGEVLESYIDVMGHMNVAWYTHFFSQSMLGLYHHMGFELDDAAGSSTGSFALETHVRYFREVRQGEQVEIYSRFIARNEKRVHVMNFMWNKSRKQISASFEVVSMSMDMAKRKPTPFPVDVGIQMDSMVAAHKKLDWEAPLCGVMGVR